MNVLPSFILMDIQYIHGIMQETTLILYVIFFFVIAIFHKKHT